MKEIESHAVSLPNGWRLTPVGKLLPLGDLPLNIAVSPSKNLPVTNNGEVSADGHNWTMGAYATDYLEKNWPTIYGGRGGQI